MTAFALPPQGPSGAYKTYRIAQPADRFVVAACEQVDCGHWRDGWDTIVNERTALGEAQAAYIRQRSARTFREMRTGDGRTVFRFEARQRCFAEHKTRPQGLLVVAGDWRHYRGLIRRHTNGADFMEDIQENCDRVWSRARRG